MPTRSLGKTLMNWGRPQTIVEQFHDQLAETKNSTSPEQSDQLYESLKPALVPQEQDVLSEPPPTAKAQWGSFFSLFVPRQGYFITPILVDLNIAVYILMVVSGVNFFQPGTEDLIKWGGNVRYLTLDGGWWRI